MFAAPGRRSGKMDGALCAARSLDAWMLKLARHSNCRWDECPRVDGLCQAAAITGSFLEQSFCLGRIRSWSAPHAVQQSKRESASRT